MKTLEDALRKIKENPEKYIGKKSIETLDHFILGYVMSQINENGTYPEWRSHFYDYVQEQYHITSSVSIPGIIRLYSASDEIAFENYFILLQEFCTKQMEETHELYEGSFI